MSVQSGENDQNVSISTDCLTLELVPLLLLQQGLHLQLFLGCPLLGVDQLLSLLLHGANLFVSLLLVCGDLLLSLLLVHGDLLLGGDLLLSILLHGSNLILAILSCFVGPPVVLLRDRTQWYVMMMITMTMIKLFIITGQRWTERTGQGKEGHGKERAVKSESFM